MTATGDAVDLTAAGVAAVTRAVEAGLEDVWEVLRDGWLYPLWVVGASRMRAVDADWPAVGATLHHSVGVWPALVDDETEVLDVVPGELLHLRAHSWPAGAAEVLITTRQSATGTAVTLREDASHGPGTLVPRPVRQVAMVRRNREAMCRFALLVEGRAAASSSSA